MTSGNGPESPAQLKGHDWKGVLRRTMRQLCEDKLTHWAAALTYYGVLSIFPGLLALVSLLGLFGQSATPPPLDNLTARAARPARRILTTAIQKLEGAGGAAGLAFVIGLA